MNNKEQLTNATMKALQGKLKSEIDTNEDDKKKIAKMVESYAKENNLDEFGKLFVAVTTDEELMIILRAIIEQYYNNIKTI